MPFGAHETMEAHEILNEKLNVISHFSMYLQLAGHPALRQLIERHLQTALQAYDQMVAYTHDYSAANRRANAITTAMPAEPQQIEYGLRQPMPVSPQMNGRLDDRQIAMAVLLAHKNSARNQMNAALECADPNVRQMMLDGALLCARQAYETFLFMNENGLYQVPTMQDHTAKTFLHAYKPAYAAQQPLHNPAAPVYRPPAPPQTVHPQQPAPNVNANSHAEQAPLM